MFANTVVIVITAYFPGNGYHDCALIGAYTVYSARAAVTSTAAFLNLRFADHWWSANMV